MGYQDNRMTVDVEKVPAQTSRELSLKLPDRPVLQKDENTHRNLDMSSKYSLHDSNIIGFDSNTNVRTSLGCMYDRLWSFKAVLRWARHFVPVAALLSIPLALFATIYSDERASGIRLLGLFVWLEVLWGSLWISKFIAMMMPTIFVFVSGIVNSGVRKYHPILRMIETALSLLFWIIIAGTTVIPITMTFDQDRPVPEWLYTLRTVCIASIAVAAMVLVERLIIQIININYSEKQFCGRIKNSKNQISMLDSLYVQSTTIFPPFCREFAQEDYTIITGEVDKSDSSPTKLLNNIRMAGREVAQAFGQMASDITGASLFNTKAAHTIVTEALEAKSSSEALAIRLWKSFSKKDHSSLTQKDLENAFPPAKRKIAQELFTLLDVDQNGDVSLEEMILLWGRVISTCHIARTAQKGKLASIFKLRGNKDESNKKEKT
jgi:Ca2+-binding EF-hand superfamily protein